MAPHLVLFYITLVTYVQNYKAVYKTEVFWHFEAQIRSAICESDAFKAAPENLIG